MTLFQESFSQLHESELHYDSIHRHSCATCKKSLPSPHLLELHIQETHDSFFAVMSERKPSYQCFLPTCQQSSWTSAERHDHAIKEHKFPPDYRFDSVKKKTRNDNATKLRKKKGKSEVNGNNPVSQRRPLSLARLGEHFKDDNNDDDGGGDMDVDSVNNRMSSAQEVMTPPTNQTKTKSSTSSSGKKSRIPVRSNSCKVPKNLSFGAGIPRGFLSKPKVSE